MGGLVALNFVNAHQEVCAAIGLEFPVTDLYSQARLYPWSSNSRTRIAEEYDFDSVKEYEPLKVGKYNPANNPEHITIPIRIWHGKSDKVVSCKGSINYINKLKQYNKHADIILIDGAGHGEVTYAEWSNVFGTECSDFFNQVD